MVKVGAATETEMSEKKHRVQDALQATRAALEEGIVAGGGITLLQAAEATDRDRTDDADEVRSRRTPASRARSWSTRSAAARRVGDHAAREGPPGERDHKATTNAATTRMSAVLLSASAAISSRITRS